MVEALELRVALAKEPEVVLEVVLESLVLLFVECELLLEQSLSR